MKSVTCNVPADDLLTIDEIASNLGVDRNTVFLEAVSMYLADYESLKQAIEEGQRDVREGRTYSHEEVMARFSIDVAVDAA